MISTILVTGSEGFIGRALCAALEAAGVQVKRFSRSLGHDLLDKNAFSAFQGTGVDAVVHLAGKSFVPDSWKDPDGFELSNVGGTRKVIEFCQHEGARLLHVSSYVYGTPAYLPIDEAHPVQAFNPYARSKVLAEEAVRSAHDLSYTIVRPFNIYGPGQDPRFLIAQVVQDFVRNGEVVVQNLKPKRDYLFVEDMVDGLRVLLSLPFSGETYNLGAGISHSVEDVLNALEAVNGSPVPRRATGMERENEVMDVVASCRLTREGLWKPKISLQQGIRKCLDYGTRLQK